jgi:site-specific DNA-methyltransferase (adenine-specific)/site-specific DNA-methyltransferase (cytosine-N4-specific)
VVEGRGGGLVKTDDGEVIMVEIDRLAGDPRNPRDNEHAVPGIAASIGRFGFAAIPVVRPDPEDPEPDPAKRRLIIVAGHTRIAAAVGEGRTRIPAHVLGYNEAEGRAYMIADNKSAEAARWDDPALGALLGELRADEGLLGEVEAGRLDDPLEGLGFDDAELYGPGGLLAEPAPPPPPASPSVQAGPPSSEVGEVYVLGPHRLICGDCRDPEVIVRLFGNNERANVAITSPPYASRRTYDEASGFRPIPPDEYVGWFDAVQRNTRAHLANDGSWFVNIKAHAEDGERHLYVIDLLTAHCRRWNWRFVDEFCWQRNTVPGRFPDRFKNGWEPVYHFTTQKKIKFRPDNVKHASDAAIAYSSGTQFSQSDPHTGYAAINEEAKRAAQGAGFAYPNNVIECSQDGAPSHTAPFPVKLPGFFVCAFTDPGDIVFDPFLGSGTTLIAAAQHGRRGFGCEISPTYCDVIRRRWTAYARQLDADPGLGVLE